MDDPRALLQEARALGLLHPLAAFEVHCAHCHARLDGRGDCATCGLIGRSVSEVEKAALGDPAGTARLLRASIDRRNAYRPAGRERSTER